MQTIESLTQRRSRPKLGGLAGTMLAIVAGMSVVVGAAHGPSQTLSGPVIFCASRVIIVDTSSSDRSPELANFADRAINAAAESAVVCGTSLAVYGVAGGGAETTIVTTDNLAGFTPFGPTPQIRALRFSATRQSELDRFVSFRLRLTYDAGDPRVTSVTALYWAASQYLTRGVQVLLITDGVNEDSQVNLNRPLATGDGAQLAHTLSVSSLRGAIVTVVGLAQVDAGDAPPSTQWPDEIWSFSATLCHKAKASRCRLFAVASVSQSLNA